MSLGRIVGAGTAGFTTSARYLTTAQGKGIGHKAWCHTSQNRLAATSTIFKTLQNHSPSHPISFQASALTPNSTARRVDFAAKPTLSATHQPTSPFEMPRAYQIAEKLPVVAKIKHKLAKAQVAIVVGAPGSGKSEQVGIAIGKHSVFDLKQQFFDAYVKQNHITSQKDQDLLWRQGYYALKTEETEWLKNHYQEIKQKLLALPDEVILLDEFDLDGASQLSAAGAQSAALTVELAKDLTAQGKKILLIMHETGLNTPQFVDILKTTHCIETEADVVRTEFLSLENQLQILMGMGIAKHSEAENITDYTAGLPAAYLPFLQHAQQAASHEVGPPYHPTAKEFIASAKQHVEKNVKVAKKISPDAMQHLERLLKESKAAPQHSVTLKVDHALQQALLETGLVTSTSDGVLLVPGIVHETLS